MQNRSAFEAARIATMLEKMEKREDDDAEPPLKLSMHLLGLLFITESLLQKLCAWGEEDGGGHVL